MKRSLSWVSGLALFVAALWLGWSFRAGNSAVVDVDLLWVELGEVALWRALVAAVAAGALLMGVVVGLAWLRGRLLNRRYRAKIRRLESELHQLRSLPLASSEDAGLRDEPLPPAAGRS